MYYQIQKRLQHILCSIDVFEYTENVLNIRGWIFSEDCKIDDISIILKSKGQQWDLLTDTDIERLDVYNFYKKNQYAQNSGFSTITLVKGITNGSVWLKYRKNGETYRLYLGSIKGKRAEKIMVKPYAETMEYLNLKSFEEKRLEEFSAKETGDITIDVVIPVYNGFQYLEPLFNSIKKTQMKYRLIVIDDCSPDKRIKEYLRTCQENIPDMILIENEENLGFVKSVNKGLQCSHNHVALVNTDVEVPEMWLERLMKPILENDAVASTTPYTNAGVICSFPKIGEDNKLFHNMELKTIDDEFKKIKPRYVEMPTGVGFCMGMNRRALDIVGLLDEENFEKGYGEENDWCQRAIQQKMRNVQVENLFVYHKHGGSFLSEDKKKFIEKHTKILLKKHPEYNRDIAYFFEVDENKDIRKYVEWKLLTRMKNSTTVVFNHSLGGGATVYLEQKEQEILNRGEALCLIQCSYDIGRTEVIYKYQESCVKFRISHFSEVADILDQISIKEIVVNELVSYPKLYRVIQFLIESKKKYGAELTLLGHDFYMVCPTIYLLDENEQYCKVPDTEKCEQCLKNNCGVQYLDFGSMKEWRSHWKQLIDASDHVIVFSNDSKNIIERAFGKLNNIQVIPHQIDYLPAIEKKYKHTETLNIGLLGTLNKHKGLEIVKQVLAYIEENGLNINVVLVGECTENIRSKHFVVVGRYTRDMLPRIFFEYDIDLFWISSICPETFSYTTQEIMTMNFPIMCFDLGAPAERVRKYERGYIIPNIEPDSVISVAMEWYKEKSRRISDKKILFIVENITFSSRYRVEHLREQLLYEGITSDCVQIKEALKLDLQQYESIVIYRNTCEKLVRKLVHKAHKVSKKIFYDIDDFIFEYDSVGKLGLLEKEYDDVKGYCDNIKNVMRQCDAYITSTNTLAKQISISMQSDKVYVNRNVASAEMAVISETEKAHITKEHGKIILGYFSGSKTHDKDFEMIKDVLLELMEKYNNVWLRIGGQIELSTEFSQYFSRIERFDFVSWKSLPKLIASVDINLMPLEDTLFHACKSENKWQEAALVGVPTVASYNEELAFAITDGKDGYLCRDSKEWKEKLENLIVNEQLRDQIAETAHQKVMEEYTTYTRDISNIKNVLCGFSDGEIL